MSEERHRSGSARVHAAVDAALDNRQFLTWLADRAGGWLAYDLDDIDEKSTRRMQINGEVYAALLAHVYDDAAIATAVLRGFTLGIHSVMTLYAIREEMN